MDFILKAADLCRDKESRDHRLKELAEGYAHEGDFPQALQVAGKIGEASFFRPHKDQAYQTIAKEYARRGELEKSLALVPLMTLQETRAWTLIDIGSCQARSGKPLTAAMKKMLRDIKEYRERDSWP